MQPDTRFDLDVRSRGTAPDGERDVGPSARLRPDLEEPLQDAPKDPIVLRLLKKCGADLLGAPVEGQLVEEEEQFRVKRLGLGMRLESPDRRVAVPNHAHSVQILIPRVSRMSDLQWHAD